MKKIVFAVTIALALTSACYSYAFETPAQRPDQQQGLQRLGKGFHSIASGFGCPYFSFANFIDPNDRTATLEYLPKAADKGKWTRMMTVTVFALTGDAKKDIEYMSHIRKGLQKQYEDNAKIIYKAEYKNAAGEPGLYINYEIGSGDKKEHNAGAFLKTGNTVAAFIQIQSRGKPLSNDDIRKIHTLVSPELQKKAAQ